MNYRVIVYLLCIDNGLVVCQEKENKHLIPYVEINGDFNNSNEIKEAFVGKYPLDIKSNDFQFLRKIDGYVVFYSAIIDLNFRANRARLYSFLSRAKVLEFMCLQMVEWDPCSEMVIECLSRNPNYKDAFTFIEGGDKFDYYSPKTRRVIKNVFDNVTNMWQFDSPDVVVETKNGITGVECFQINASGKDFFGSVGERDKKEMEKRLYGGKLGDVNVVTKHFCNSLNNLWKDFESSFKKHLDRIKGYRKNLKTKFDNKRISIGFYVNDTTLLGTYCRKNGTSMVALYLFNIQEFWDLFLESKHPLFIIFQQTGSDIKNSFFITKHDYQTLKERGLVYSLAEIDSQFFNDPNLIGATIPFY